MVRLRVLNGTSADVRLCDSCKQSTIMKDSTGRETIYCAELGYPYPPITRKIVECTGYLDKTSKSLSEFKEIGWVMEVKGKTILGFKPPERRKDED